MMTADEDGPKRAVPIHGVAPQTFQARLDAFGPLAAAYAAACGFKAEAGQVFLVPGADGALAAVLFGVEPADAKTRDPYLAGKLAALLPEGDYALADGFADPRLAVIAFERAAYRFTRFRKAGKPPPRLETPAGVDAGETALICGAITFGRDLINRPTNDLGPDALEAAIRELAETYGASCDAGTR